MPLSKSFFPDKPSADKSTNKSIVIPRPSEQLITHIKSTREPTTLVEIDLTNPTPPSLPRLPVLTAPEPKILPKNQSFFRIF